MGQVKRSAHLAAAIEERRKELDLTISDLLNETGLSRQALQNIRNGEVRQYQERLTLPLTRTLRWTSDSIDRLIAGDDAIEVEPSTPGPAPSPDLVDIEALLIELQDAIKNARTRDAITTQLMDTTTQATERLTEVLDLLRENTRRLEVIEEFVHWREASLQRGSSPQ